MKNNYLIYATILLLSSLYSCKKEVAEITQEPIVQAEAIISDSASFTIDGKLYTMNAIFENSMGNSGTNLKLVSAEEKGRWWTLSGGLYWSGNKDSVQYSRGFRLNSNLYGNIEFSFLKKYARSSIIDGGAFYYPSNDLELFHLGNYPYAFDYNRENKVDGVAITVNNVSDYIELTSFSPLSIGNKTTLDESTQSSSIFKITKLEQLKDGRFLIEATFEAILFDKDEKPVKLEKGFLRSRLDGKFMRYAVSN